MASHVPDPLSGEPIDPLTARANQHVKDYWLAASEALLVITDALMVADPELPEHCDFVALARGVAVDVIEDRCDLLRLPVIEHTAFRECMNHLAENHEGAEETILLAAENPRVAALLDRMQAANAQSAIGMDVRGSG